MSIKWCTQQSCLHLGEIWERVTPTTRSTASRAAFKEASLASNCNTARIHQR